MAAKADGSFSLMFCAPISGNMRSLETKSLEELRAITNSPNYLSSAREAARVLSMKRLLEMGDAICVDTPADSK